MRKEFILTIIVCLIRICTLAQCPIINTISTNPSNYQNESDPTQLLKWDWRLQSWTGYRPGTPTPIQY